MCWICLKPTEDKCSTIHRGTEYWSAPKSSSSPGDSFFKGPGSQMGIFSPHINNTKQISYFLTDTSILPNLIG